MTILEQRAYESIIDLERNGIEVFDGSYNTKCYWEKLKHQYAGMALQGLLASGGRDIHAMAVFAKEYANELIRVLQMEKKNEEGKQ